MNPIDRVADVVRVGRGAQGGRPRNLRPAPPPIQGHRFCPVLTRLPVNRLDKHCTLFRKWIVFAHPATHEKPVFNIERDIAWFYP